MPRRPILPGIDAGTRAPAGDRGLRDVLARWASGVAVLAVRQDDDVLAMTVTAFLPVSLQPPLIAVAVGEHLPLATMLTPGTPFAVSILGQDQRRWANVFADAFAADRSGFPAVGDPVLSGCTAALACVVVSAEATGDHLLVLGDVASVHLGDDDTPLLYFDRGYRRLGE